MSTTPFCPHLDQQTERPAERNHCLLFAVLHPVINLAILQDIPCKMSKYFLFLTLCSIYASAGFSVQMESVGGKAILLQNSRQLIQSDSQAKVDGLETFSSMFARLWEARSKAWTTKRQVFPEHLVQASCKPAHSGRG